MGHSVFGSIVCTGRKNGEHRLNLDDCGSFFVCNFGESKLFPCPTGLLYDHSKRACNWESQVDCDRNASPDPEIPTTRSPEASENPTTNSPQTVAPTTISTQSPSHSTDTTGPIYPTIDPPHTTQVYNGKDVHEISPDDFRCMDPGFYFAPDPRNCKMYFICESYRIHLHECGEGVYWDYVNNRCSFPTAEICYPKNLTNNFGQMVCSSSGYTVEYKQVECRYISTPVTTSPPVVTTSPPVVTTSPPVVTTSPPVVTTSPPVVTTSPPFPACPEAQAFIPHENDCRKYYICIQRMPIATVCPDNTAWDKSLTQCNEESWKQCIG